jgi:transposase
MKSYSNDLRERVVRRRGQGHSAAEVARWFAISKRSVERYWGQQQKTGSIAPKQRGGYRRSRLAGHEETLRQWIQAQADLTLVELQARLRKELRIKLGLTALWVRLEQLGLSYKKNPARRRTTAR